MPTLRVSAIARLIKGPVTRALYRRGLDNLKAHVARRH